MALLLERTGENGVKTAYHRIASFVPDFDKRTVQVAVRSYTDQAYRDTEKNNAADRRQIEALREQIDTLLTEPTKDNEQERIDLSEQLNAITERQTTNDDLYVFELKADLPVPDDFDYSLDAIYELIKTLIYTDAKDC